MKHADEHMKGSTIYPNTPRASNTGAKPNIDRYKNNAKKNLSYAGHESTIKSKPFIKP